jgi:hypothetical protein
MKINIFFGLLFYQIFLGCVNHHDRINQSQNYEIKRVVLLKPELIPRIKDLLNHNFEYSDNKRALVFMQIENISHSEFEIYLAAFPENSFGVIKYRHIPNGFFSVRKINVFVFGNFPDNMFSNTEDSNRFSYFALPEKNVKRTSKLPELPALSFETGTWIYKYQNGTISLLGKRMVGW